MPGDKTNLIEALHAVAPSGGVHTQLVESVIPALIDSIAAIGQALRTSHQVSAAGSANAFGDAQLNVDVLAEKAIRDAVAGCPAVATASSEEDPVERPAHPEHQPLADNHDGTSGGGSSNGAAATEEHYTVAFDPLDGSSIAGANWAVGTLLGVWQGPTALGQAPAAKQVAAVLGVYGPRTTAVVAVRVPGCDAACLEVGVSDDGSCQVLRERVRLADKHEIKTRYFAPANLRAAADDPRYLRLVTRFIEQKYTLRYSGGLVPDVVHALAKGHGVYVSPVTANSKAKLRRLYELYPVALVVEAAGGRALDPADGSRILDRALEDLNETAGLLCGSPEDVGIAKKALLE
ncbi:fructose-1-6-bisphosphatase [Xylariomycetidae sp. FL0641]|nr:fructose-1-6-bisphosphatase [Xylariomycetidae sp. FL0641]